MDRVSLSVAVVTDDRLRSFVCVFTPLKKKPEKDKGRREGEYEGLLPFKNTRIRNGVQKDSRVRCKFIKGRLRVTLQFDTI